MKEIAEKYPKMWHQLLIDKFDGNQSLLFAQRRANDMSFNEFYGFLVFEFFPKHDIKIGYDPVTDHYRVYTKKKYFESTDYIWINHGIHITPQAVIAKACEILEKRLEGK